jgi:Holliday junction DNA helicase RuvA
MIAYIQGILTEKTPTYAVLDSAGVGFMLNISLNTYSQLPDIQQTCKLYTHLSIKEDAHTLYAFHSVSERQLFRLLIGVSGVGANTARMILSAINPKDLVAYISSGNANVLQSIKGIGSKTAQRIIIELKDKVLKTDIEMSDAFVLTNNTYAEEALSALTLLGFSKQAAGKAVEKIIKSSSQTLSVEEIIKQSLKIL